MRVLLRIFRFAIWGAVAARAIPCLAVSGVDDMERDNLKPWLVDKTEGRRMLGGIGSTKFDQMIASGQIETVKIGSRRLVRISSLERLAGVEASQHGEELR